NFMVGVGPNGQGSFHPTAVEQLREAGQWLKVNGEGNYATRPREGILWMEGDTLRFTRSKDQRTVYCFTYEWPGRTLALRSLQAHQAGKVEMLGFSKPLASRWDPAQGLVITIPEELQPESNRPCEYAWGFRISSASAS
ncbi:MAG: alpha-L-fucosidase C-terminal domain-containing protein, partial [Terracidiphilus sp.]